MRVQVPAFSTYPIGQLGDAPCPPFAPPVLPLAPPPPALAEDPSADAPCRRQPRRRMLPRPRRSRHPHRRLRRGTDPAVQCVHPVNEAAGVVRRLHRRRCASRATSTAEARPTAWRDDPGCERARRRAMRGSTSFIFAVTINEYITRVCLTSDDRRLRNENAGQARGRRLSRHSAARHLTAKSHSFAVTEPGNCRWTRYGGLAITAASAAIASARAPNPAPVSGLLRTIAADRHAAPSPCSPSGMVDEHQ